GKSHSAIKRLLAVAMLNVEVGVAAIPTLHFVTASVSSTPEREAREHTNSVAEPNLRTIGASQRFVISSDYSHHSGPTVSEAEVDSLARSFVPLMTTITTVTAMVDPTLVAKEKPANPSLFYADSSSAGGADPNTEETNSVFEEKDELLKARDEEIENRKAQMLLKEAKVAEAIRLRAEFSTFETVEKSLWDKVNVLKERNTILEKEQNALDLKATDLEASVVGKEHELTGLNAQLTFVKSQNDNLLDRVRELELSSFRLQEKVTAIEKGMQDGLSAGITHGTEGRALTDLAAYNPSAEADYISALQHLQNVNFSLLAELRSNKDANVDTLMNILRLEETLTERLGVDGAKVTSDTVPATADTTTTLSVTLASANAIFPISVDDYEVEGMDDQAGADGNAEPFPNADDAELNIS
ncbi:hypothetical protein Tco_0961293, partial [Tanacetum coccineum]